MAPERVRRRLGVGSQHRAGDHDRRVGVTAPDQGEERPGGLAEQGRGERDARPAVRAVRDRDHGRGQPGELLRGHQLAACRAGVAEIDDVQAGVASGDRGPRGGGARRHPSLGDRVAVGQPAGLGRRGRDRTAERGDGLDDGPHALGEVHDHPLVGVAAAEAQARRPLAEPGRGLVDRLTSPVGDEAGACSRAAVAEVGGAGAVAELHLGGVTDQLESHADRELRAGGGVERQAGQVVGVGPRVRDVGRRGPPAAPDERLGRLGAAHRSAAGRLTGWRPRRRS